MTLPILFLALRDFHSQCIDFVLQTGLKAEVLGDLIFEPFLEVFHLFLLKSQISIQTVSLLAFLLSELPDLLFHLFEPAQHLVDLRFQIMVL